MSKAYRDGTLDYDTNAVGDESGLACRDPSLADQSAKEEADINNILKAFGVTGKLPQRIDAPQLDMFTDIFDYQSAMNALVAADRAFMAMPADVRSRFGNDAGKFVDFCSDPANLPEMVKLGLADPPPAEVPAEVPAAS